MKPIYQEKLDQMITNFEDMRKPFKWEHDMLRHLAALTYVIKNKIIDIDEIKSIQTYIKKNTGALSPYRGHNVFAISSLLCATSKNPKAVFDGMLSNEKLLKAVGFKNATYLPTALYALSNINYTGDVQQFAQKAGDLYKSMRSNHPFLTSGDDYALAILLADSDHDANELEEYYHQLNNVKFSKSNGLQMLSHILSFSNKPINDVVSRCTRIYDQLKMNKLKVYSEFYPALGLIALIDDNLDEQISDLVEITQYLRKQKRYKYLGKGMNTLLAASIVTSHYIDQCTNGVIETTVTVSIEAIIAAQQAAMIAAISASTAAATSAAT